MRRFYKEVGVSESQNAFHVLLDGKPVKTPQRRALALPTSALAEAIAGEWRGQGEDVKPETMPLTRLAYIVIDIATPDRDAVIAEIHAYANSDLLCYRATEPPDLIGRQTEQWDPLLEWAEQRFGAKLTAVSGLIHRQQPQEALAALRVALDRQISFALAAMHDATTITGSLVLALALAEARLDARQAFALSWIDETFQAEKWGQDVEADTRAKRLQTELEAAERFLQLSKPRHGRP